MVQIFYRHIRSEKLKTLDSAKVGSWVNAVEPSDQELLELAETYGLDHSLLLDGVDLHESPRIENEDGATYIYTRFCYREGDHIHTSPMLIVYTKQHLITVLPKPFAGFAKLTHGRMPLVTTQKTKLLLQILAEVQNSYTINLNAISRNIFQIRSSLRQEEISNQDFISFIDIEETLNDFLSGLVPTASVLRGLMSGRYVRLYEEDEDLIEDLTLGINELIELTKSRLTTIKNVRDAYSTITANNLNRVIKMLTSLTIIITIPTIISSIYGMNVTLPLMHKVYAFWFVVGVTAVAMIAAGWVFKRNKWF
jgi:magnesium transporter